MKKKLLAGVATGLLVVGISANAHALSFTFSDQDFLGGASWGTMTIDAVDNDTLSVRYDASSAIPSGSEATSFAFGAIYPSGISLSSITNPGAGDFAWDSDGLNWVKFTKKIETLPTPANADEFTGEYFSFAATEGTANNITPPGILPGASDIFYLNFSGDVTLSLINWTGAGVRLQSLPDAINGGSLLLIGAPPGTPIPEPATMLLFGTGLAGLVGAHRARKNAKA